MLIVWSARILISIFQDSVTQILGNEHGLHVRNLDLDSMMVYFTPAKVGFVQPLTKQTARPAKLMGQGDYLY